MIGSRAPSGRWRVAGLRACGLLFLGVLLPLMAGCADAEPDPVSERLQANGDGRVSAAVKGLLNAYGGHGSWRRRHTVEYSYRLSIYGGEEVPQFVTHQLHRLGLGRRDRVYLEDLDVEIPQVVRLNEPDLLVTRGGQPVNDPDQLQFPRTYGKIIRWTFRIPWLLLDPASQLEWRGIRTPNTRGPVPAGPCEVVRLRFNERTAGGGTDDWYDFYISQRSHLVEQIHSYRAEDNAYRVDIWSDHRTYDDLRVASRRETFASDVNGAIGPLEAVAAYEKVRFDAPFDEAIFNSPVSLAMPRGGE